MRAALLVGLVACTDATAPRTWCPQGEKCSPLAPEGLGFGRPTLHSDIRTPAKFAVGTTSVLALDVLHTTPDGLTMGTPLDVPYTATVDSTGIGLEQGSSAVTIHVLADTGDRLPAGVDATLDIRDSDGLLLGRTEFGTAPVADITSGIATFDVQFGNAYLCFEARSEGHQVYGATWQYTVDGAAVASSPLEPNCIHASEVAMRTTMTIVVSAAGASLTVTLPVI